MKERLIALLSHYLFWVVCFVAIKPVFLLWHWSESQQYSFKEWLLTIYHGFPMDLSMAGYLSLPILLIILVSCFFAQSRAFSKASKVLMVLLIVLFVILFSADLMLYKYWGFRLDTTPLFYLSSPKDAAASGTILDYILSLVVFGAALAATLALYLKVVAPRFHFSGKSLGTLPISILIGGLLFLAIRGGVGVSTMNVGRCYFSQHIFLNHAAINPVWNFLDASLRSDRFEDKYRFMNEEEKVFLMKNNSPMEADSSSVRLLKMERPNVVLIIMEGIGSNVVETLGGVEGVTPQLGRLMSEGVLFTHFFANSFRTDRGLISILSGYPAQPTTSVLKYPTKSHHLPKIATSLKQVGYDLAFFYGGDDNFTNLHSYLVDAGFETIVSEKDFSRSELSTKWGAYDHVVLERLFHHIVNQKNYPFFKTILTLNSHEPFDVPMKKLEDPYLNSVAYTDSCIGDFVGKLRASSVWDSTLVVILPDHAFRYPNDLSSSCVERHEIPMLWLGGALACGPMRVDTISSQMDLAKTFLRQLNVDASDFIFSKDIFSENSPHFAYYAFPDGFGFLDTSGVAIYDNAAQKALRSDNDTLLLRGKAFLQHLYDDLSKR